MKRILTALLASFVSASALASDIYIQYQSQPGIPRLHTETANRLLEEWFESINVDVHKVYRADLQEPQPYFVNVRYMTASSFEEMFVETYHKEKDDTIGTADPKERLAIIEHNPENLKEFCLSQKVLYQFSVARHEILHNLGLVHQDTNPYGFQKDGKVFFAYNLMAQGRTRNNVALSQDACRIPLNLLSPDDLLSAITTEQYRQIHEALEGGPIWQNLLDNDFDFSAHADSLTSETPLSSGY